MFPQSRIKRKKPLKARVKTFVQSNPQSLVVAGLSAYTLGQRTTGSIAVKDHNNRQAAAAARASGNVASSINIAKMGRKGSYKVRSFR